MCKTISTYTHTGFTAPLTWSQICETGPWPKTGLCIKSTIPHWRGVFIIFGYQHEEEDYVTDLYHVFSPWTLYQTWPLCLFVIWRLVFMLALTKLFGCFWRQWPSLLPDSSCSGLCRVFSAAEIRFIVIMRYIGVFCLFFFLVSSIFLISECLENTLTSDAEGADTRWLITQFYAHTSSFFGKENN